MKLKTKLTKFLIGTVFLIALCISSIQVVFAEGDISMLIGQWFDQQKTSAVASMESAIGSERDQQMIRLKAHLQSEMERAQGELSAFEEQQIAASVQALRDHTDQLIGSVSYSNEADQQAVINELNAIYNAAITSMGSVQLVEIPSIPTQPPPPPEGNNGNPGNSGNGQGAGNDGENNGNQAGENNGNGKGNTKPGNEKGKGNADNGNQNDKSESTTVVEDATLKTEEEIEEPAPEEPAKEEIIGEQQESEQQLDQVHSETSGGE